MKKRIISCITVSLYIVSLLCMSVSAVGMTAETGQIINSTGLNELNVRLVVNSYFEQRLAYLKGECDEIAVVNIPMGNDEAKHKAYLETNNIAILDTAVVLDTIECWGNIATVTATEIASFLVDGQTVQETIAHTITVYNDADNILLLQSDAYIENTSGFESCSYILADGELPADMTAIGGSGLCIVSVAMKEMQDGNGVRDDGTTKYGAWYGEYVNGNANSAAWGAWCAMFVSWCAHHSNISESIIPCIWGVPYLTVPILLIRAVIIQVKLMEEPILPKWVIFSFSMVHQLLPVM